MGFSTSAVAVVLLIGATVSFGILFSAVEIHGERVNEAVDDRDGRALTQRNTALNVTGVVHDDGDDDLNVTAANTGTTTLLLEETDVLVDGELRQPNSTRVDNETSTVWPPGTDATFEFDDVSSTPDRVVVVAESGVADVSTEVAVV